MILPPKATPCVFQQTGDAWNRNPNTDIARTFPAFRAGKPPRWLTEGHHTLEHGHAITMPDGKDAARIVLPDGRVLNIKANGEGLSLARGFAAPPGWRQEDLLLLVNTTSHWVRKRMPWSSLKAPTTAHAKIAQRAASNTDALTIVLTSMCGEARVHHPLWTLCVRWHLGGMAWFHLDTPCEGDWRTMHEVMGWSWDDQDYQALEGAFSRRRPWLMALWGAYWPVVTPFLAWRHRKSPFFWVGEHHR